MRLLYFFFTALFIVGCTPKANKETNLLQLSNYDKFGDDTSIKSEKPNSKEQALALFQSLKEGEQQPFRFETTINSVCVKKGCWMRLDLGNNKEAFVKFKDYAFLYLKM